MKYIYVTGGVVSGLGKGVTASSIGVLLKSLGLRCTSIKIDPYLNIDAGTMSPFEHGEVFVLDDGGEVDLDLGNYERFIGVTLTRDHNITTGKIFKSVIEREREGAYLGKTVQVVPHLTDAIQDWIERVAHIPVDGTGETPDVCIIELGGTVGDIESGPFLEALRQFQFRNAPHDVCSVHVSLVPVLGVVGEQKTKPTQHSVQVLRSVGIAPNFLACRSKDPLEQSVKDKLALFCHVPATHVMNLSDVSNIWHVPLVMRDQGVHEALCKQLNITPPHGLKIDQWEERAIRWDSLQEQVEIAIVGKYTGLTDSYLSVMKALQHAAIAANRKLKICWIEASDLEESMKEGGEEGAEKHRRAWAAIKKCDGILVPGGFGGRGTEGKADTCKFARENNIPFLGICLGMQVAVIEFARNVLMMENANSTEIDPATPHPVVVFMPEGSTTHMGGTMRLGSRRTFLQEPQCLATLLYQKMEFIDERHRHRYEVNPEMIDKFEEKGLKFVGKDETGRRMEIIELKGHPFYVACQFHPEYKSRPGKPSALFLGLVLASSKQLNVYMSGYDAAP
uniref:CTP synthase n=1 Tax=Chloropicon laureae TaxID=464258 RepID=A0A7S2YZ90_9CHLO|mmetsp:Transcript_12732/g.32970  ORF Transcript_12732/g.32970 Transcript_12732/m.32970 type:complete len:564 (+) Transcript_12732:54-1745(+)|eukprot:CAMPEP_0197491024 /NCGR_PEP_ID=MMETSP1311-20131121/5412_1 /TAXON_ID=464262 /ORGANISM="Genus nov. species nov., Strain RCC856" /LENGTH=563 /DNA_ID=CAMNT_0043035629 /DNA_START=45 /DNA_END=1736 /DNA_ORIENTATION=+